MISAQQFIEERINSLKTSPSIELPDDNKADLIFKIIMSKKFRKYSVTPEYQENIKKAIATSIEKNEPIKFVWVFGGYKLWSLEEAPLIDWAELFSLLYFINWLSPILHVYKPGVLFDFYSDDVIVPIMNNIPASDIEKYIESYRGLLTFLESRLPEGFKFTFNRVIDQYRNFGEFKMELDENIDKLTEERKVTPKELTPEQIAMIDLNVILKKDQSLDEKWRDKIQIIHDAYSMISKRRPYYRNPEKIMVLNTPIPGVIAVGTTKTSVVKFWIGSGALKKREESYQEYILSPKQLKEISFSKENISITGLNGRNFRSIKIFE